MRVQPDRLWPNCMRTSYCRLPVAGQVRLSEKLSQQHAVCHVLEHCSLCCVVLKTNTVPHLEEAAQILKKQNKNKQLRYLKSVIKTTFNQLTTLKTKQHTKKLDGAKCIMAGFTLQGSGDQVLLLSGTGLVPFSRFVAKLCLCMCLISGVSKV